LANQHGILNDIQFTPARYTTTPESLHMIHDAPIRSSIMDNKIDQFAHSGQPHGRPAHIVQQRSARTKLMAVSLIFILSFFYLVFPFLSNISNGYTEMAVWKLFSALFATAPLLMSSTVEGIQVLSLSNSNWTVGNAKLGIEVPAKFPSVVRSSYC
jgi:hypothetical protein